MNIGNNKHYNDMCIAYLQELISVNQLNPPYVGVNLCHKGLLKKYFPNCSERSFRTSYSRMIQRLKELDIIYEVNGEYVPNKKCKLYNISNKNIFKNPKKSYSYISMLNGDSDNNVLDTLKGNTFDCNRMKKLYKQVAFRHMRVKKDISDDVIMEILFDKYPCLADFSAKVESINAVVNEGAAIWFKPTITRAKSGTVTKVGIRAYTIFSYLKSYLKDREKPIPYEGTRESAFDKIFGQGNWVEYDVHGSVPRVARLVNKGIWDSAQCDPYEGMFASYVWRDGRTWDKDIRDFYKTMFMRLYFGGSVEKIYKDLQHEVTHPKKGKIPLLTVPPLKDLSKGELLEAVVDWKARVTEYTGATSNNDTSVFLHESCIYILVREELAKRGIDCYQVYDGFFCARSEMPQDMDDIIEQAALTYYKEWYPFVRPFEKERYSATAPPGRR